MRAIEIAGEIDGQHRLLAQVPPEYPAGPVRLVILPSDEDREGMHWALEIAADGTTICVTSARIFT